MDPKRTATALISLIVILALGYGGLYYYMARKDTQTNPSIVNESTASAKSITLSHKQTGDTHTYTGVVETPTPCHMVGAAIAVSYGKPPSGRIDITTSQEQGGVCAQVVTAQEFSVALMSSEKPEIQVMVDGSPRQVAVVEAN